MSTAAAEKLKVTNVGTRRIVIGPGAKSKGGGAALKFDTTADEAVPAAKRIGNVREISGADATRFRESKTVQAMSSRLGLRLGT